MRALIALLLMTGVAAAQDYPFQGLLFATDVTEGSPPEVVKHTVPDFGLERCATTIIDQRADGGFTTYIIDLVTFRATGEIAYDPVVEGKCTIAADGLETCRTERQSASLSDEREFYDVPVNPTGTGMDLLIYNSKEDAEVRRASSGYYTFHRCPVNADLVRAGFRTELSALDEQAINDARFASPELLKDPAVRAVMKAIQE